MSSWQDTLAAALAPTPHPGSMNDYERVTREVVDFVNQKDDSFRMDVRSRFVGNNQRIDIISYPRRRPVERSAIISMSVSTGGVVWVPIAGNMGQLVDKSPETLRQYLVEQISSENFIATVGIYRQRNAEPVEGWLKKLDYRKVDLADVALLAVSPEQDKLVAAFESSNFTEEVEITADLVTPVGNFRSYNPTSTYTMLDSGGFVLRVVKHAPVGATGVRIRGVLRGDLDWRSSE